ncbi:MAG TPA: membrane protein insertase YidC, partial [Aquificaceae bacterium]|nr:membrane protein insertase YidC [Aquificaceae bacterium]
HIDFAGEESRYFFKGFKGSINSVVVEGVSYRPVEGEERRITFTYVEYSEPLVLYMGAKYYSRLRDIHLQDLLDWGMLKIFVKPLFVFMYWVFEHTGSWIVSIVLLTLILRVVFFPLNYKSMTSMMKLQKAAPRLEKIRKKYKDDPAKMQEEMMKLYSEIGFNPMSGCLPILVQIPIFFALYKVLIITVDLKLSGMLWIPSLADKDPIYLLPIIMGLTMVLQQKLMPSPDPKQNLIMYISAVAFTFLFASFPSGLVLYWTVNNILNIGQNYLIKNVLLKEK